MMFSPQIIVTHNIITQLKIRKLLSGLRLPAHKIDFIRYSRSKSKNKKLNAKILLLLSEMPEKTYENPKDINEEIERVVEAEETTVDEHIHDA